MQKMKKCLALTLGFCLLFVLAACGQGGKKFEETSEVTDYVKIVTDGDKDIIVKLEPDKAPITVKNFQDLVAKGFYNGLTFHRIVPGFVVQGGDPSGDGTGGPGYYIKGEFPANGVNNDLKHEVGTLSMARSQAFDSAGSQFFICLTREQCQHLDGQYAAFGQVIQGMDVVEQMVKDYESGKKLKPSMKKVVFVKPV